MMLLTAWLEDAQPVSWLAYGVCFYAICLLQPFLAHDVHYVLHNLFDISPGPSLPRILMAFGGIDFGFVVPLTSGNPS